MVDKKYNNVLTIVLVIVVIAIIGVLGFYGYEAYKNYTTENEAKTVTEEFDQKVAKNNKNPAPAVAQDEDLAA